VTIKFTKFLFSNVFVVLKFCRHSRIRFIYLKFMDMKLKFKQFVQQCFMCLKKKTERNLHGTLTAVICHYFLKNY